MKIKWQVITKINIAHIFHRSVIIFQYNPLAHLPHLGTSLKIPSRHKSGSCIRNIPQQPFALLHYCATADRPSVASEAQTNGSPTGQS
jgi:hypothetical protein